MKSITALLLITFMVLNGCKKDDDEVPRSSVTITIDDSYQTKNSDNWLVIYDVNGNILGYKTFEAGATQVYQLGKDYPLNSLTIAVVSLYGRVAEVYYYAQISPGNIKVGPAPFRSGITIGKVSAVCNVDEYPSSFAFTNKFSSAISWSGGLEQDGSYSFTINSAIPQDGSDMIFSMALNHGKPRFKKFAGVKSADILQLTYNDLTEFDQNVKFSFPPTNKAGLSVLGRTSEEDYDAQGYLLLNDAPINDNPIDGVYGGYLNDLSKYTTELNLHYGNYTLSYQINGAIPDGNILWPTPDNFTIGDTTLQNFSAFAAVPFKYRKSSWLFVGPDPDYFQVDSYVFSGSESQKLGELPSEILQAEPDLSILKAQHYQTEFFTKGSDYKDIASAPLIIDLGPTISEQIGIGIIK